MARGSTGQAGGAGPSPITLALDPASLTAAQAFALLAAVRPALFSHMALAVFTATVTLASCGARSGLTAGAGASAGTPAHDDAGDAETDVAEAAPPDAPIDDPCTTAPALVAGAPVSGTTCGAPSPAGSTCSTQPTAFYAFELPAQTDLPLHLSGNLLWGVLCQCPEGPGCCVGPGGDTGPQGLDTDLANPEPTPRAGVLAVWRSDEACGDYTVSIGP